MLISFEGIDGSGKSTQARLLVERLSGAGIPVMLLREPGGTTLSEHIRTLLLDPDVLIDPFAELLLFSAARAQLVSEKIVPSIAAGIVVVTDRFFDSTTAYQGGGRGIADPNWLRAFHAKVTGGVVPDVTYYIALDPDVTEKRLMDRNVASTRTGVGDRMELEGRVFQAAVAAEYERIAREEPDRVTRLDGSRSIEQIHEVIWRDIQLRLGRIRET